MRVLDLFSGPGGFSQPFRDRGHEVVTLDNEARFEPDVLADIRRIRFPGLPPIKQSFDQVLASHVLEHVSDLTRVMSEIHDVLKVGGTLRIYLPYGLRTLYNPFHVRPFKLDTINAFSVQATSLPWTTRPCSV
ncbi:MAG: class I SAM-dependent methyltransferase [candidate division NC10 bacterium]